MPHIDEGTLHAWLDGALDAVAASGALPHGMQPADVAAHLEQCADCRARLERERDIRERAGLVLGAAAPPRVHTPPLDPVSQRSTRSRRLLPLAWAASLLMAAGAGWWGSQLARDPRVLDTTASRELGAPGGAASSAASTESAAAPPSHADAEQDAYAGGAPLQALDSPAAAPAADRFTSRDDALRMRASENAEVSAAPTSIDTPRDPGVVGQGARTTAPSVAGSRDAPQTAAAAAPSIAQAPPPPMPAPPRQPPLALDEVVVTGFAPQGRSVAAGFLARDSAGLHQWVPVRDTAVTALVDAEIIAAERTSEIGARITRVTQRLGTGDTIEVLSWTTEALTLDAIIVTGQQPLVQQSRARTPAAERAAAAQKPQESAPLAGTVTRDLSTSDAGTREVLVERSDGWVLVRAPAWLRADDIRSRLGAVFVAGATR